MMARVPVVSAQRLMRALEKAGFEVVRSTGSHHRLVHRDDATRATTIPVHKGRDLPRPFVAAILKQARLTIEELVELL